MFLALRRVGGMPKVLERLSPVIDRSPWVRAKGSYDELIQMTDRPPAGSGPYVRAWLLAVAADTNLELLDLSDDDLPPLINPDHIRALLGQERRPTPKKRGRPPSAGGLSMVV